MAERQKREWVNPHGGSQSDDVKEQHKRDGAQKACGAAAGACQKGKCRDGRQGYWNVCSA